jgi:hypothetical protein
MQRPTGVTILAILSFILAGLIGILGLTAFAGGAILSSLSQQPGVRAFMGLGGGFIGAICLVFAAVYVIDGIGLLKVQNWGRILTIVLVAISLFFSAMGLLTAMLHFHPLLVFWRLIVVAIDVWILVYLFKSEVKRAFGAAS